MDNTEWHDAPVVTGIKCDACGRIVTRPNYQGYTHHHADDCLVLAAQVRTCPDHPDDPQTAFGCLGKGIDGSPCAFDSRK